jgi:hypothetical protein
VSRRGLADLPPWARWVGGILVGVVALNVGLSLLRETFAGPDGKPSSAYATVPEGTAAYAELLARNGFPVVPLRGPLTESLPDQGVLVVLDPEAISEDEISELRSWIAGGGYLVIGGRPGLWAEDLLDDPPAWSPAAVLEASPLADVPETRDVTTVGGEGFGTWEESGAAQPVLGLESASARTLVSVTDVGAGRVVLLADTSVLHNRFLARNDNAVFGLNLAGEPNTPVHFAEGVHGYGTETGLAAIPTRWKLALGGLALATIVWMVAAGRRLGPPEAQSRDLPPPRRAYVDALTTTLARTKRGDEVVAPVRAAARSKIARRSGLEANADERSLEGAGRALGLTEEELAAVFGRSRDDVVAAGRALVKLGGRDW